MGGAVLLGLGLAVVSVVVERPTRSLWSVTGENGEAVLRRERSVYFTGGREARAAGAAPIYPGEPGYLPEMNFDDDHGVACEPAR